MKILQCILFAASVLIFASCAGETTNNGQDSTGTEATTTNGSESTTGSETSTTNNMEEGGAAAKITDAVIEQVCNCKEGARQEDGSVDYAKMGECMGGKTGPEFVADLLGASATDKDRSDGEKALREKMNEKCPN